MFVLVSTRHFKTSTQSLENLFSHCHTVWAKLLIRTMMSGLEDNEIIRWGFYLNVFGECTTRINGIKYLLYSKYWGYDDFCCRKHFPLLFSIIRPWLLCFFKGKLGFYNITALNNQLCHRLIYYIISHLGLYIKPVRHLQSCFTIHQ